MGDFSFIKLCKLLTSNEIGFINLLFELEMNISDIIKLYDEDEEAFSELSKDKTIAFLKEYGSDIDYEYLIAIFNDNSKLFYALVDDPDDVIQNIGVKDFIDKFEDAQAEISEVPMDDPYHGAYDPYDSVRSDMIDDGCPDEFLMGRNSDEWSDDYY